MRRSDVSGRVIAALRTGNMAVADVAKLVSIPNESARLCLAKLARQGRVRIVARKKGACHTMPSGQPRNVYALV